MVSYVILTPYTLLCSLLSNPMCRTGVCRMSERLLYSTAWYRMVSYVYSHTLHTFVLAMYFTAWYRMYIHTPYTYVCPIVATHCVPQACVGRQIGSCVPPQGIVCIFAHPTHLLLQVANGILCRFLVGVKRRAFVLQCVLVMLHALLQLLLVHRMFT